MSSPLRLASQIQRRDIPWLWPGRIPRGTLTLLTGAGGQGKSTVGIDLLAHVSTGRAWFDGTPCPHGLGILYAREDGAETVIYDRLVAADADLARVAVPTRGTPHGVAGLGALRESWQAFQPALVVFDSFKESLGGVNVYREQDVRLALRPLLDLLAELDIALVGIVHPPKDDHGLVTNRVSDSYAFLAVARAVYEALPAHGSDPRAHLLSADAKTNWTVRPDTLMYRTVGTPNGQPRIEWGAAPLTILHAPPASDRPVYDAAVE